MIERYTEQQVIEDPDQTFVVYSGEESYQLTENIMAIGLAEIVEQIVVL